MLSGHPQALVMTYGYAMTVHKSQGSQWDSVVVLDDWTGSNYKEWLYTGLTRAAKRVTLVRAKGKCRTSTYPRATATFWWTCPS